ncbi:chemotaxis protein CheA [Novosphingobium ovatum]|uniref:chemotaxis protein CheA n=1 Tax=Novosphingobium ovatum TaxID=1908523 RepID=UPI0029FEE341|nr:chemotaxis protein CheA [Novosphingobium ovatum]
MSDQDEQITAFLVEAEDVLDQTEQALLDLGSNLGNGDLVDAVFRGLHTIKGSGAMFGFNELADFTHKCETAFDKVRKNVVPATGELVSVILAACDHMRAILAGDANESRGRAILGNLSEAMEAASFIDAPVALPQGQSGWHLTFRLPPGALGTGAQPLSMLAELADMGDARVMALTDAIPPLCDLDLGEYYIGWDITLVGPISRDQIEDVFLFMADDMDMSLVPLAEEGAMSEVQTPTPAAETSAPVADAAPAPAAPAINVPALPDHAEAAPADSGPRGADPMARQAAAMAETVRVPADRLDELMNRVGELVIAQSRLSQLAGLSDDLALRSVAEEMERLSGDLRSTTMVLRMVPVSQLFSRFRRLVHDLARETGKGIELVTEGETTEVDKTVVERLFDPLVHIIRNSCDHGLEDAAARAASGKPASGTVRLMAHQAGGQVVITIADDGRGIDTARVRAKAEAQGLIDPNATVSEQDIMQLIFHPGFSTAAQVTNLSGRGVGMDVVKRTIEMLRGQIEVQSRAGQGTEIALRIPLTLAIVEGLLVRVGQQVYVIPLSAVEECLELSGEDDRRSRGRNLLTIRDRLVPFLRLREMFSPNAVADLFQKVVVVASGDTRVGLVVDQIIGSHQTVIKSMSPLQHQASAFAGATILGDGTVALILDIGHLLNVASPKEERLRAAG